jgi:hypothetical protein
MTNGQRMWRESERWMGIFRRTKARKTAMQQPWKQKCEKWEARTPDNMQMQMQSWIPWWCPMRVCKMSCDAFLLFQKTRKTRFSRNVFRGIENIHSLWSLQPWWHNEESGYVAETKAYAAEASGANAEAQHPPTCVRSVSKATFLPRQTQASRTICQKHDHKPWKITVTYLGADDIPLALFPVLVRLSQRLNVALLPASEALSQAKVPHLQCSDGDW